jgi:hypothetical protein
MLAILEEVQAAPFDEYKRDTRVTRLMDLLKDHSILFLLIAPYL